MSFGYRTKETPSLRDRFRGKSSDQILEELRKKIDQDKDMFFDRVPNPPSFRRAGFPFDDNGSTSRSRPDFRHRLEELAQQHPEFADSLRPWYSEAQPSNDMGWSFRQRTGSGSGPNGPPPQPQPEQQPPQQQEQKQPGEEAPQPQPGEQPRDASAPAMEPCDPAQDEARGQRAQSAPPDNPSKEPQRFVSRLDINPAPEQQQPAAQETTKPPAAPKQAQQPGAKPASNVRQIPIFVEGRDEPVMAKHDVDSTSTPSSSSSSSSSNFSQPFGHHSFSNPGFGRPGHIHDNLRFGDTPRYTSSMHHHFNPTEPQAQKRPFPQQQHEQPSRQASRPHMKEQAPPQQQQGPREATPPPAPKEVSKPREQVKPKDALEKVQEVRMEVDALAQQVESFAGQRQDKQYLYLDEMLTRNLIKLDVIETEGREDVRAARKETIRAITQCISKLESKVSAPVVAAGSETVMETDEAASAMEVDPSQQPEAKTEPAAEATPSGAQAEAEAQAQAETVPAGPASAPSEAQDSSVSSSSAPATSDSQAMEVSSVTSSTDSAPVNSTSAPES